MKTSASVRLVIISAYGWSSERSVERAPVATAASRTHLRKSLSTRASVARSRARSVKRPTARSGTMFARRPPSTITPGIRTSLGSRCFRRCSARNRRMRASSALIPCSGAATAWAARPRNVTSSEWHASDVVYTRSSVDG